MCCVSCFVCLLACSFDCLFDWLLCSFLFCSSLPPSSPASHPAIPSDQSTIIDTCSSIYLHSQKRLKLEREKKARVKEGIAPLQRAWNDKRLRAGDCVGDAVGDLAGLHPNQWSFGGVLLNAWQQIGKSKVLRAGIDGIHRALGVLVTVASALNECQNMFIEDEVDDIRRRGSPFVLTRHYDCTPIRVLFGSLQDEVMPYARYAHFDEDLNKTTLLSLQEYLSKHPKYRGALLRFGTPRPCYSFGLFHVIQAQIIHSCGLEGN